MTHERCATIDILALVITFFGIGRYLLTTTSMRGMTTNRTNHHLFIMWKLPVIIQRVYRITGLECPHIVHTLILKGTFQPFLMILCTKKGILKKMPFSIIY